MAEHRVYIAEVIGSNPMSPTLRGTLSMSNRGSRLAQRVGRDPPQSGRQSPLPRINEVYNSNPRLAVNRYKLMKNILDIYSTYKIMPALQQHQLRVAAVAKQICDSISSTVDKNGAVIACLVHDMGNIIKFDLTYFPDFLQPEGLEYWQKVKNEFIKKYGTEEHIATKKISKEIGLSETQISYLDTVGFSQIKKAFVSHSLEQKICCYADQRVGPYGVLSIKERLIEGRKRYEGRKEG